jgi:class 3 adenylate cyclase
MDIRRWLEQRDLGKYAEVLIENEVQFGDLPELTEDDFSELGFPLGPRRRILRAIRELDPTEFSDSPPPSDSDSQIGDESHAAWTRHPDDRRPVTLLFADLTGSTALTEQLDPEDTHDILYGAVQRMGDAVEAHRGTVCRFMGDGLMAMFGVPTAFESHAQQACLGALALQEAIEIYSAEVERDFGAKLQARVGLHSGEIVALQVGEGERREWDASGPAVPIAARLEQSAQPGTVQMTESTFDLVRPYFEGTAMEPVRVKGIRTPLSVIRLEHAVESEPTAAPVQIAPFVGRRTETGQMTAALESCLEEGSGQTLFVRGEAGVGKSRLVQEVLQTADSLGFMHHSALVLDFGAGKDQDPISSLTKSLLQLPKHPTEEQGINVVERAFADEVVNETEAAFVFDLLDVSKPPQVALEFEAMDPERRRRGRRDVFRDIVARLSRQRPTLIVVEDVHYADEITLDYLRELMRATFDVPLVLLMTTRPSQDPLSADWQSIAADAPITIVNLRALRDSESQRLAAYFEGLPPSKVAACIERSDGNPLFLIELLRAGQRGLLDSMPTSVQTIAVARMDELQPDDKEAIQAAAVLGQRFELETLRGVLSRPNYEPTSLVDAQFVRKERDDYLFNHGLIKDAVVGTLLRTNRRRMHKNAAAWFEDRDLGLWAFHLEQAEDPSSSEAYETAAQAEALRFRFEQAVGFIDRAIELNDEANRGSR